MTGDYTFQWQYVVDAEDGAVSGRVVDLRAGRGWARPRPRRQEGPADECSPADFRKLGKQALACALVFGIWFSPIPAGLTREAWHLFAVFAAAIFAVIVNAFPLLTASLLAGRSRADRHRGPAKAFAGFANSSVLLVVVAFLVANAVVKSGLGRRISLLVVSAFGRSTLGLGYSIFSTDALIAPAFPSNTARGGALPDHSFTRPERWLQARRCRQAPPGRLSHVLRHGEPERLVGAYGHLRQPDRRIAGSAIRREDRLRHVAAGLVGSSPGHHPAAAPDPFPAVSTRGDRHARCARARAPRAAHSMGPPRATSGSSR